MTTRISKFLGRYLEIRIYNLRNKISRCYNKGG